MPFSSRIGVAISDTLSMVNARPIGEQKCISDRVAQAPLAELRLDEEGDLERRRRALVGHAGDADHDPAAGERVQGRSELGGGLGGVEVMGLGLEVLDRLGHDARARSRDEVVVAERHAVGQVTELAGVASTRSIVAHDELDALVEERPLGAAEVRGLLAAHRDVHEAGLIDVLAGRVDDDDLDLAAVDLRLAAS